MEFSLRFPEFGGSLGEFPLQLLAGALKLAEILN
jgi:hypothetical protein